MTQVAVIAEAPIFQVLRALKKDLSPEIYTTLNREVINASLAVAKHHYSLHDRHQITLACRVAATILSIGLIELGISTGNESFFRDTSSPFKKVFQVGWSKLKPIFDNAVDEKGQTGEQSAQRQFLSRIAATPGASWYAESEIRFEKENIVRSRENRILSLIRDSTYRLFPSSYGYDEDITYDPPIGYDEDKTKFFLQVLSFSHPRFFANDNELNALQVPTNIDDYDRIVNNFIASLQSIIDTKVVLDRIGDFRKIWISINKRRLQKEAFAINELVASGSELQNLRLRLGVEIPPQEIHFKEEIEDVEYKLTELHEEVVDEITSRLNSAKDRQAFENFLFNNKHSIISLLSSRNQDKILDLGGGKAKYVNLLKKYIKIFAKKIIFQSS